MLKQFHALPTEERARNMKGRDYLWSLAHTLLDGEEALERLCPACRAQAMEERCPCCGKGREDWEESTANAAFDWARFSELRGGQGFD